jgi:GNAT superfamily N-acetyltransferase
MIRPIASTPEDLDTIRTLFREYQDFLQVDLCFQSFDEELDSLPGKYAVENNGGLYVLENGEEAIGCVAYYRVNETTCELKRLYVRPQFHGAGLGRALMERAIEDATRDGYQTMILDTLRRLEGAGKLYARFGFEEIEPYNYNPQDDVVYYSKSLASG